MARGLTKTDLETEWYALPKNWYALYQWKRTTGSEYLELISEWIVASFPEIQLIADGLRTASFRVAAHRGQIKLRTEIKQLTEKRFLRAMFNSSPLPLLGNVIDYEIPLKEKSKDKHGDIDLLCVLPNVSLCVEAKKPGAGESILKAVLQSYAYTSLVATKKQFFLANFGLDQTLQLTPAILTFASAQSGRQLNEINRFPRLLNLIETLNSRLASDGIASMRFFVVENLDSELTSCLTTTLEANGDVKAVFRDGFTLSIVEKTFPHRFRTS